MARTPVVPASMVSTGDIRAGGYPNLPPAVTGAHLLTRCLLESARRDRSVGGRMRLGILCGGGPAPGMNSVISAATIEARNSGWDVVGILDGFQHLIEGRTDEVRPLPVTDVSRIHLEGGSVIRTSRANPTVRDSGADDPDWRMHACLGSL